MTHYDMSGSEDGQLRSPGDEQFISGGDDDLDDTQDTDSLDIKPPQATVHHSRDSTTSSKRRSDKYNSRDKKHSKERRQHRSSGETTSLDREERRAREERERIRGGGGGGGGAALDMGVAHQRYQQRNSYERHEDMPRDMNAGGRYPQKHYDRGGGGAGGGARDLHHHHPHMQPQQHHSQHVSHMQRRPAHDYYEERDYHHHANDYQHNMRATAAAGYGQSSQKQQLHHGGLDYVHDKRRKYVAGYHSEEPSQADAESLEQDLRSRLLSKRHKYAKDYEPVGATTTTRPRGDEHKSKGERLRRDKQHDNVIEVFDSPDVLTQHRRKHKRHTKNESEEEDEVEVTSTTSTTAAEKRRAVVAHTSEDAELLQRRNKLLVAERELTRLKEVARTELLARREHRRGEQQAAALSPTAVAANVTAGLNVVVKRRKEPRGTEHVKRKKAKKMKQKRRQSDDDVEMAVEDEDVLAVDVETTEDEEDERAQSVDSDVEMAPVKKRGGGDSSDTDAELEQSYKNSKKSATAKRKHKKSKQHKSVIDDDDDEDHDNDDARIASKLPDSPLSFGELSKSPHKQERSKKRHSRKNAHDDDDDEDFNNAAVDSNKKHTIRTRSRSHSGGDSRSSSNSSINSSNHSRRSSRSASRSSLESRSPSRSSRRSDGSLSARSSRSRSSRRHHSRSRSHSRGHRSLSRTPTSHSRSRSRTRSEERDMKSNLRKSNADEAELRNAKARKAALRDGYASPTSLSTSPQPPSSAAPCDDKGARLPNYFPGIQGCRSVEEFQCLNRIEEGTYGVVYRAKDKRTNEIVALKRLKMEKEKEGFPITSLREINTLLKGQHPNIVTVREIVVGSNMDKIFIVMDYVEHDLKSLMETMKLRKQSFLPGEVKCLTQQLLRAVGHLHDNWILHRDLKTSNLLLSHKGILKVGDFGLAREYGSPLKKYTSLVVTLWYRAPELLLCSPEYSTPIDVWSVGCIFAEFLQMAAIFPGKSEIDELNRIFKELGTPNEKIWPGYKDLPAVKNLLSQNSQFAEYPVSNLRKRFHDKTTDTGISLLQGLLTYDPKQRLNADAALKHAYFRELPLPIDPSMFPTWPAKSELGARKALASSPKPPSGGSQFKQLGRDEIIANATNAAAAGGGGGAKQGSAAAAAAAAAGFSGIITGNKKTAANTGFVLNAGIEQRQVAMGPGFNLKF